MLQYNSAKHDCNFVIILDGHRVDNLHACPSDQEQVESRYRAWSKPGQVLALFEAKTIFSSFSLVEVGWPR